MRAFIAGGAMLLAAGAAGVQAPAPAPVKEGPVLLANVTDSSPAAVRWRNGLELGLREINARGGILGRQVVLEHVTVGDAAGTLAAPPARRPYVVLGPNAPGSAGAAAAAANKIPQILGPAASAVAASARASVVRLSPDPVRQVAKLAEGIVRAAKSGSIALAWRDDETGRSHHQALVAALAAREVKVAIDMPVDPQQVDFSPVVVRAKSAAAEALVADLDEEQATQLMRELRRQGYDKPVVGGGAFLRPRVVEAAGEAIGHLHALVGFSTDLPVPAVREFLAKYERAYGSRGDHSGLAGYAALYLVRAVSARTGKIDGEAFAQAMNGILLSARDEPGLLLDVSFDERGYPDYEMLILGIRGGKPVVFDSLAPGPR